MSLDGLNKWLGPLANVGVLGGLLLVAVQMHQNTAAIRSLDHDQPAHAPEEGGR